MKQKLKAPRGKLLIHPIRQPTKSEGGLHIPGNENKREAQGVIIHIGPGCVEDFEFGDHVLYNPYSGDKVVLESGGEFFVIHETHIIAVRTDSDVVMMDTETVVRLLNDRRGELMQKHSGDREKTEVVRDVVDSVISRVEHFAREEGME